MKVCAQKVKKSVDINGKDSDFPNNLYKNSVDRTNSFLNDLHNKRCKVYENIKANSPSK